MLFGKCVCYYINGIAILPSTVPVIPGVEIQFYKCFVMNSIKVWTDNEDVECIMSRDGDRNPVL